MAQRPLSLLLRKAVENRIVDQTKVESFVAAVGRSPLRTTLSWSTRRHGSYELCTAYGCLCVSAYFHRCWTITRDGVSLVNTNTGEEAIVVGLAGAKATALFHLRDGYNSGALLDKDLSWNLDLPRSNLETRIHVIPGG